ncbi:DUF3775 domain-containing protein [Clostridium gasigenes]|uniref:DUF3775 domain-containing protein n=1 Tax=Clostridium gasigenes TaxID=94869 RepID=UPI001438666C|nr:DUF3775 domain-containing protein [Clostridium gasigenes]MBB6624767.1 DUF3775 domain-containing protein [Clostridium gasigenes]MBU3103391.1 DUF3775 domain-containing protein [Clostridium gasigenes]MBU3133416.1 DUF3775 domain-containing protein [Clostridium gasigenes]MBU3136188.1 DUF3775 domain-containing protein [Clostridium gasigenes]NKF07663.1 DUF3775 domain-containing protein [Clostridium gasigenes]
MKKLNEIKEIVVQTIKLSDEFHRFLGNNELKEKDDIKIRYSQEDLKERRKLSGYLESFDDDTVLTIQAIMYIGRDEVYSNKTYSDEAEVWAKIEEKKKTLEFETKETEVDQMVSKSPLGDYLRLGLKLLGL